MRINYNFLCKIFDIVFHEALKYFKKSTAWIFQDFQRDITITVLKGEM